MKKTFFHIGIIILCAFWTSSCTSLRESSKYEFRSSKYYTSIVPSSRNKVYLDVAEDTIRVFQIEVVEKTEEVNTQPLEILTEKSFTNGQGTHYFYNPSFDLDIITMPLKYRFSTEDLPNQLTTNINGNLYLGYRNDIYSVKYKGTPLNEHERVLRHFGTSFGGFAGIAAEPITPWFTRDAIDIEYSGFVFSTGFSWIAGFNNLSAGFTLGFDYLLDPNRAHWVYQGAPWIGLAFGINLN